MHWRSRTELESFLYKYFSLNTDGYAAAQQILQSHRDAEPENPTIIRLQYELALKVVILLFEWAIYFLQTSYLLSLNFWVNHGQIGS